MHDQQSQDTSDRHLQDVDRLLPEARQAFGQWTFIAAVLGTTMAAWTVADMGSSRISTWIPALVILMAVASPIAPVLLWLMFRQRPRTLASIQSLTFASMVLVALPILVACAAILRLEQESTAGTVLIPINMLTLWIPFLVILHCFAFLMVPASALVSIRGPLVLIIAWAVAIATAPINDWDALARLATIILGLGCMIPGAAIAAWQWNRCLERLEASRLKGQVERLGGELIRAREVHEGLFPQPIEGAVRFEYLYEPNEQIGGDFVHAWRCPRTGRVTIVLMDVVGHGLTAALTVNRLSGELDRLHAEYPDLHPGELMTHLNRYIFLTMAKYSLYTTAGCFEIDPVEEELRWALSGHPPALLRRANGSVEELDCTSVLLGALSDEDFDADERKVNLEPGDVIITYTDGTIEARNLQGQEFTLARMRECVGFDTPPRNWPRFILNAIERHHGGNQTDDVLVVCITYEHPHLELDEMTPDPLDSTSLFLGTPAR